MTGGANAAAGDTDPPSPPEAKRELMARAWRSPLVREMLGRAAAEQYRPEGLAPEYGLKDDGYRLSAEQAQAILELRLQRLTGLEQDKIRDEYREVMAQIADLIDILEKPARITAIIGDELRKLKSDFADPRRTEIVTVAEATAILDLKLHRLTGLEQDKIIHEFKEILDAIVDHLDILANEPRLLTVIRAELLEIKDQYGDERRTEISEGAVNLNREDLVTPQDMVVTFSHGGYVKSQPLADYRAQRRGGRGRAATAMKEDDFIERLFVAHSHDYLLCFSDRGRLYWLKVFEVPQGSRASRGKPVVNMFPREEGEKITAVVPVKEFDEQHFVLMATARGTVKKTPLAEFSRPRPSGIIAVSLEQGDYLVGGVLTDGGADVMLFSSEGKAVRFAESEVRPMGRQAGGVRGMRLPEDGSQRVVCMLVAKDERLTVLTATEFGYGKRTPISEYTKHGRGGQGLIAIQASDRNGRLVGAVLVDDSDQVMLISTRGVLIRTKVSQIREQGRSTQGVTLIALGEGEKLAGLERIEEKDEDVPGNGNGSGDGGEAPLPPAEETTPTDH